jgi:hypothetical protein
MDIREIEAGLLKEIRSWIFYPPEVEYYYSQDGKKFIFAGTIKCDIPDNDDRSSRKDFILELKNKKNVRHIKIVAKNYGVCPQWHLGAGGTTWIFADEITVR